MAFPLTPDAYERPKYLVILIIEIKYLSLSFLSFLPFCRSRALFLIMTMVLLILGLRLFCLLLLICRRHLQVGSFYFVIVSCLSIFSEALWIIFSLYVLIFRYSFPVWNWTAIRPSSSIMLYYPLPWTPAQEKHGAITKQMREQLFYRSKLKMMYWIIVHFNKCNCTS